MTSSDLLCNVKCRTTSRRTCHSRAEQDGPRQALCDYIDASDRSLTLFDFPTKGILQEAVQGQLGRLRDRNGKPPGLLGWWPKRAVTFLDNHDTGAHPRCAAPCCVWWPKRALAALHQWCRAHRRGLTTQCC
jgi:hypothetical protein